MFERDLYRCVTCGTHLNLTIDHKRPVSLGGGNDIDNLQTMCMPCNAKRMTVYMRLTLWRICGGPSERIPGALALVVAPLTFRPDSGL